MRAAIPAADLKPVAGCRKMTGRPFLGSDGRASKQPPAPTTNFTVEERKWSWHHVAAVAGVSVAVVVRRKGKSSWRVGTAKFWGSPFGLPSLLLSEM